MNYDAEIARLVDLYSAKCAKLTGKPEHRREGARRLLVELADAIKKLVRESTLQFYESKKAPKEEPAPAHGPLFVQQPHVPKPPPGTPPPVIAQGGRA